MMNQIVDQIKSLQTIDTQLYYIIQYYTSIDHKTNSAVLCNVQLIDENNYKYTGLLYCNTTQLLFESCCIHSQLHELDYTPDDNKDSTQISSVVSPVIESVSAAAATPTNQQHSRPHSIQHVCYCIQLNSIQSIEQVDMVAMMSYYYI